MPFDLQENEKQVFVFDTAEELAMAAAERFILYAQASLNDHGLCSVTLAGGNTPRRMYQLLATEQFESRIEWSAVHLFFSDERCVPPDDPDSNYGMVHSTLISKISIPKSNVHRIIGEGNAEANAESYERELRAFFPQVSWPLFDLVLLGIGEDGHTASIFPGTIALVERSRWVLKTRMERLGQDRITLTAPVLNHAKRLMFLVTGSNKARVVADVLHNATDADQLPARAIQPLAGTLEWLLDKAAAAML